MEQSVLESLGEVTIVSTTWLESVISRLHASGDLKPGDKIPVEQFRPAGTRRTFNKGGTYRVTDARQKVQGNDTLQKVFNFLKGEKEGATSKQMLSKLKIPPATLYLQLRKLQDRKAISKG